MEDGILGKIHRKLTGRLISGADRRLLDDVKRDLLPPDYRSQDQFVPQRELGHAGYELREDEQLAFLRTLSEAPYPELFRHLRQDSEINPGFQGIDYREQNLIHNGFYPTPDGEIYAAMIAKHEPKQIIEVGSGYSTVIARRTLEHLGRTTPIRVIDPQPRRDIEAFADEIEYRRVEESSLVGSTPGAGTLLFIDSSHVCRSEGDVPFLFCQLLPSLPAGVLVHVHDVFLPYDYPDNYYDRFYTEQYLLHALLAGNPGFRVRLAAHYLSRTHRAEMQSAFGSEVANDPLFYGAAFWMET